MPDYRSLIGGFFSSTPLDKSSGPVTIRTNNPGAINGAPWEKTYPGYVSTVETTPGNHSTIFEAPEYGIGAWWDLLRRYHAGDVSTVEGIINKYGGGQDYSAYVQFVVKRTGFVASTPIDLNDDQQLLKFGSAMFRYEAGQNLPWSDDQILYGIRGGRGFAATGTWPTSPTAATPTAAAPALAPALAGQMSSSDLLPLLQQVLVALASGTTSPQAPSAAGVGGSSPAPASATAPATASNPPVLSSIDKLFGGQALVGNKTTIGVISYAIVAILQAVGVLGTATPAGQILSVLTIAFSVLGGVSKIDRLSQSLGTIAANSK